MSLTSDTYWMQYEGSACLATIALDQMPTVILPLSFK